MINRVFVEHGVKQAPSAWMDGAGVVLEVVDLEAERYDSWRAGFVLGLLMGAVATSVVVAVLVRT